ncbi:MAG: phosphatase PAP2 family protein, partial [Chloroflexota bacterium]|nr:phosphatase PAP2 family protein [Chloroflexota bacterium]
MSWLAIIAVVLLAIALSLATRCGNTLSLDLEATRAVQALDGQPWRGIAGTGNALGESTYAVPVAVTLLVISIWRRDARNIVFIGLLLILRSGTSVLKEVFESPRPTLDVAEVLETFDGFGFPSGHATTSAVALGGVAFLIARHFPATSARWSLAGLWLLGMVMTGYARIWVGAHWLTDVIGGSLYGIGIVLIAANISAIIAAWIGEQQHRRAGVIRSCHSGRDVG